MNPPIWPTRLAISEGVANARTGGWISLLVTVLLTWTLAAIGIANSFDVERLIRAEKAAIQDGSSMFVVTAQKNETPISVQACERLNSLTTVHSFAYQTTTATLTPASAPGSATTMIRVSAGVYEFAHATPPQDGMGVVLSTTAGKVSGLVNGENTTFTMINGPTRRQLPATAVVTDTTFGPLLQEALLLPSLVNGSADECVVSTIPAHVDTMTTYASAALASPSGKLAIIRPMVSASSGSIDFLTAYHTRPLHWAWTVGAAVLSALWALIHRMRQNSLAIYRTYGAHRKALLTMQFAHWSLLSLPGLALAMTIGILVSVGFQASPAALAQVPLQAVAAWAAASLVVLVISALPGGNLLAALKDGL